MKIQDIQIDDKTLRDQYIADYKSGQYSAALEILQNAQLQNKKADAAMMNAMGDKVLEAENLYYDNVDDKLAVFLQQFNINIDNLRNMGQYSSTTQYEVGNFVTSGGDTYFCIAKPPIGTDVDNATYWEELSLIRGEQGAPGLGLTLKYNWASNVQYAANDVVYYSDGLYYAKKTNLNSVPSSTSEDWGLLLKVPKAKIYVGKKLDEPNKYTGLLWWKITETYTWAKVDSLNYTFADINNLGINWNEVDEGGW